MNARSPSYKSVPLSKVQIGAIGQLAFLAAALASGEGEIEAYTPAVDNEGRDAEIRRHLKSTPGISIQVKTSLLTETLGRVNGNYLSIRFSTLETRVQNDPRLRYFFAYYEKRELRLHDPSFLVPSQVFHRMGLAGEEGGRVRFNLLASLAPQSHDRWSRYRVPPTGLGKRLLEIIDDVPLSASSRALRMPPDSVLLGRAKRPMARKTRNQAA
jgi:hypothetical protein